MSALAYHKALSGKRLNWEPEYGKADKASSVVFKKFPIPAPHLSWDIASQVEARELLRDNWLRVLDTAERSPVDQHRR
jgi:hypothetical protein